MEALTRCMPSLFSSYASANQWIEKKKEISLIHTLKGYVVKLLQKMLPAARTATAD